MQDKDSAACRVWREENRAWVRRFQEGRTWEEALRALIRAQREGESP